MEKDIKREKIEKTVFHHSKRLSKYTETPMYTWREIKKEFEKAKFELQDDDVLFISYDDGHYGEDFCSDPCYYVEVTRIREETDEELEARIKEIESSRKKSKEKRYERYLELKKEFESENL